MKMNEMYHSILSVHNNDGYKIKESLREAKQFHASQQSTSHKGVAVDRTEVKMAVKQLNQSNELDRTNIKFVYHEDLHEYYVTVVDPVTNEVMKEIPPKKMLDMFVAMTEYMGILVDERI